MVNIQKFLLSLLPAIGDRPAPVFLPPVFATNETMHMVHAFTYGRHFISLIAVHIQIFENVEQASKAKKNTDIYSC
jgi:hypothetical protein